MTAARTELLSLLRAQAARAGDAPLISDDYGTTSAAQLTERVDARARALREAGVGPGVLVGTVAWPAAEFSADVFAIISTGAVAVPLSRRLTPWELQRLQERCPLDFLIAPDSSPAFPVTAARWEERTLSVGREGPPRPAFEEAATAQITSGTTGYPRVALRSAAALLSEAGHYRTALGLGPESRLLCPVPLQHAYGFGLCAVAAPLAGAPVRCTTPGKPRVLLRELGAGDVTLFVGVPPMLRLLAKAARSRPYDGPAIGFLSAGMALDAHTAELVATRLGGHVGQVYGTTETGPICVSRPAPWQPGARGPGPLLPGVRVELSPVPGDDVTGLVTVRSPSMMLGYVEGGAVDASGLRDGFTTGDLARWEGPDLVLAGRLSTSINVAGAKVSPEEIEAVLLAFPDVAACLVSGVDDPVLGQRISATVTPDTVDLDKLERFCRERLSPSWVPHAFASRAELPTTETGKVIRPRTGQ
ncbi:class I adenylate-forming enzyme family protein [Streptomyces acidiscabies]|uniref:Class I adenylate-forming enzyme family protein n=1 Tax=Streptomyces acidiscabies TaxID=42234 RepID=A0AAP6BEW2_9ACTN|nr:class I adenylate-forming enzyme family protein [Streptomyces acidiscabies]MBP5942042.1 acyl--CoA ligase [Streptomyces sp. LBUM 1476]MBZ3913518.1 acyl--CoA ligase [Streptomyces acidiscabies]MDX2963355.1 class I adenylate-forming enzyme family protein [Streptomyces acidiscabies]MDX3023089.1 class I adenylate-forming enzyme family protein [Streptomyces acidiscabies]MDX3792767.1 class I adenylate-forming enzyme family protein [Streptomyces acidiscabies]